MSSLSGFDVRLMFVRLWPWMLILLWTGARAGKDRFFAPAPGFTLAKDLPEGFRARVRSIRIDAKDVFAGAPAYTRGERWLFGLGNKLHIETRAGTVRRRLLFSEGGEVTPGLLLETEKALRSEEFLGDAILEAGPVEDGACDIRVTTYDQWTTLPGGSVSVQGLKAQDVFQGEWGRLADGEWLWWMGAFESNLLGTGTKVGGAWRHDLERDTREAVFNNTSLTPLRLQLGAYGAWLSDGHSLLFKIAKPLKSRQDRYAYGFSLSDTVIAEKLYFDANRLPQLPDSLAAARAGKSVELRRFDGVSNRNVNLSATRSFGDRLKVNLGPTFDYQDRRQEGGIGAEDTAVLAVLPLPASAARAAGRQDALLGVALSVYQYGNRTARNYHNLKWGESLETGWRLSSRAAWNQGWLGAADGNQDFRLTHEAAFTGAWRDSWYLGASLSGRYFLSPGSRLADGQADAMGEGQWKPHPITSTVFSASWSHLFAAPRSWQLTLGEINGLSGYPSFYYSGQARFLATAEQRLFPEAEFLTLVPALAALVAAGNTFPAYRDFDPGNLHYSLGLGLRLGRSKSSQKAVQHINVVWPVGEDEFRGPTLTILARKYL